MITSEEKYTKLLKYIQAGIYCDCKTTEGAEIVTPEKDCGKAITGCEYCEQPRSEPYDVE